MKDNKKFDKYHTLHQRYLKNIVRALFKFNNLPATIDERALNEFLCFEGYTVALEYKNALIVAQGALSGLDHYYRPTTYTSANPYIVPTQKRTIDKDCVVGYNTKNYQFPETFNQLVEYTASRLADIDISIDISCRNSRPTLIPIVNDDKEAIRVSNTLETMYDGSPVALSYRSGSFSGKGVEMFPVKAKDNIVVSELADARRSVMSDFWAMLGVDTIAVDKKERTNLNEMDSNKTQLKLSNNIYLEPRERFCDAVNTMFGTNISVEFNKAEMEVMYNESLSESDGN